MNTLPLNLLKNCAKIVLEPVKGLKQNLTKLVSNLLPEFKPTDDWDGLLEYIQYWRLVFALSWFHSIITEWKKFWSLGWNIPYDFPDTDFIYSEKMLREFIH